MIRTYKIIQAGSKYNIIYNDNGNVWPEFHSLDGNINGTERLGFINEDAPKWMAMLNDLLTPGGAIITRMRSAAATSAQRQTDFTTLLFVIQNGVNGFPDEATLQTLLRLNWGFTSGEKTTINNYLTNNNFNISVN